MMKRLISILLVLAAILLTIPAMAASSEKEWNASCNWIVSHDTTLYSATIRDDATTATDLYVFTPIGTLPAGAHVSIRSSTSGGMRQIYYWNDGKKTAWIDKSALSWVGGATSSGSTTKQPAAAKSVWEDLDVTLYQEDGESISVTLEVLGTAQSIVFDGDEMLTVNTEDLYWETEADDDQRLGIVYAPKTGKATLRASASTSAKSLAQCGAGHIVVVLKVGSTFTRVLYDGKEGFILTSALTLCGSVPEEDFHTATLIYKGRTDSSATISVYTAKSTSRKIDQWRVGNEVVVLSESGAWSEVEIDGWHGWCKSEYLD